MKRKDENDLKKKIKEKEEKERVRFFCKKEAERKRNILLEKLHVKGIIKLEGRDKNWIKKKQDLWRIFRENKEKEFINEEEKDEEKMKIDMYNQIMLRIPIAHPKS